MTTVSIVTALGPNDPDDGDTGRQMRGLAIAAVAPVKKVKAGYKVPSQSGKGSYIVDLEKPDCTCADFESRLAPCKHIYGVEYIVRRGELADDTREEPVLPKRPTYSQNWKAYNEAQTNEGDEFIVLLKELCATLEQPLHVNGRPRYPISDMVFGVALKVYSTLSTRRAMSNIRSASAKGMMDCMPSFTSIHRYMEKPELKPVLIELIERSALPLASVETHFSPDSSGFGSKSYVRWFDKKWGKEIREVKWVKAHIMTGALTNIVTSADVTSEAGNDSPYMEPFVKTTAKHFDVQEVSADKAYLSKNNLRIVDEIGATPYIPFKKNSVPYNSKQKRDHLWAKLYYFYNLHRDEFLERYHQRSNVETTFSMIKLKFGAAVRSKTPVAQVNEALTKILCHNICVLNQSIHELGIEPEFGLLPPEYVHYPIQPMMDVA